MQAPTESPQTAAAAGAHRWSYCNHCSTPMVVCGTCGMNCCSGGYGEEIGPEPGTTMTCRACPDAYAKQDREADTELAKYQADPDAYIDAHAPHLNTPPAAA